MVRAVSLQASDFQRALGSRPVSRTAHFVLHAVLHAWPARASAVDAADEPKLSTGPDQAGLKLVDDQVVPVPVSAHSLQPSVWRLGLVLPKKQARRSVTRSLIRHQAREALRRHTPSVWQAAPGSAAQVDGWVVRLRLPFDRQQFPSAASDALKVVVREEMDELWGRLGRTGWRLPDPASSRPQRG